MCRQQGNNCGRRAISILEALGVRFNKKLEKLHVDDSIEPPFPWASSQEARVVTPAAPGLVVSMLDLFGTQLKLRRAPVVVLTALIEQNGGVLLVYPHAARDRLDRKGDVYVMDGLWWRSITSWDSLSQEQQLQFISPGYFVLFDTAPTTMDL